MNGEFPGAIADCKRDRGYYKAARGYEFYLRVLKVSLTRERYFQHDLTGHLSQNACHKNVMKLGWTCKGVITVTVPSKPFFEWNLKRTGRAPGAGSSLLIGQSC